MATDPQLSVTLEAKAGADVRLEDFAGYLEELRGALNAVDRRLTLGGKPTTYYTIGGLTKASPATVVLDAHIHSRAMSDQRNQVLSTMVSALAAIGENGMHAPEQPVRITHDALHDQGEKCEKEHEVGRP